MENSYKSKLLSDVDYFAAGFLSVIATASVLGHILLLTTTLRRFSTLKATEILYINLSLSDLLAVIFMYPLSIASAFNHGWMGGDWTCSYYGFMGFLHAGASIMTLTFLAVVRCIVVFNSSNAKKWFTRRNIFIIIILIWTHALLWSLMPLWGWGKYGPEPYGISCTLAWTELRETSSLSYLFVIFAIMLVVPAGIIISCYTCIAVRLHRKYKRMESQGEMSRRGTRVVRRMILITVLMSAGFLVAWTPYSAVSFWASFYPTSPLPPVVSLLPALFAKSATAYNPVIIFILSSSSSSRFRSDAKKVVTNIRIGRLNLADISFIENSGTSTLQPMSAP